jgi:CRP/FNR family cyclic AMP-dependent transcriptional regulator
VKPIDAIARRAALARTQIFQSLPPAQLDAISVRTAVRRVARNDVILRQGDPNTGMVVIMSGRVRISVVSEEGKEVTLSVLDAGEVLGKMYGVSMIPTISTARARNCRSEWEAA